MFRITLWHLFVLALWAAVAMSFYRLFWLTVANEQVVAAYFAFFAAGIAMQAATVPFLVHYALREETSSNDNSPEDSSAGSPEDSREGSPEGSPEDNLPEWQTLLTGFAASLPSNCFVLLFIAIYNLLHVQFTADGDRTVSVSLLALTFCNALIALSFSRCIWPLVSLRSDALRRRTLFDITRIIVIFNSVSVILLPATYMAATIAGLQEW